MGTHGLMKTIVSLFYVSLLFLSLNVLRVALALFIRAIFVVRAVSLSFGTWYSSILFLVYVRGILVVFAFMLASSNNPLSQRRPFSWGAVFFAPFCLWVVMCPKGFSVDWGKNVQGLFEIDRVLLYRLSIMALFLGLLVIVSMRSKLGGVFRGFVWIYSAGASNPSGYLGKKSYYTERLFNFSGEVFFKAPSLG